MLLQFVAWIEESIVYKILESNLMLVFESFSVHYILVMQGLYHFPNVKSSCDFWCISFQPKYVHYTKICKLNLTSFNFHWLLKLKIMKGNEVVKKNFMLWAFKYHKWWGIWVWNFWCIFWLKATLRSYGFDFICYIWFHLKTLI